MEKTGSSEIQSFRTKKDMAVEFIHEGIMSGQFEPGEWLRQNDLSDLLGVSATPVREALRELVAEGVLEHTSHTGVRVPDYDPEIFNELWIIRRLLEPLAAKFAVQHLSQRDIENLHSLQARWIRRIEIGDTKGYQEINYSFHHLIYKAAGQSELSRIIRGIWVKIPWNALHRIPGRPANAVKEHQLILNAIISRDGEIVAQRMKEHIDTATNALRDYLSKPDE